MAITAYATRADHSAGFVMNLIPFKHWDDLQNLKGSGVAYCVRSGNGSIATAAGTYNTPAPITLSGFNFNFQQGTIIEKVIVHYSHQKFTMSSRTAYPTFAGPRISLLGTGQSKTGNAVPTSYTANTLEFTGVTAEQLKSADFGVKIEYPKNTSGNTGRLALGNVYLEVVFKTPDLVLSMSTKDTKQVLGNTVDIVCNVERLNYTDYNPVIDITVPEGLTYVSGSGHGTITTSGTGLRWSSAFEGRNKNTVTLKFKCSKVGTHNIKMQDILTSKSYSLNVNIVNYTTTITTTLNSSNKPIVTGSTEKYTIVLKTDNPDSVTKDLVIELPPAVTLVNESTLRSKYGSCTVDSSETRTLITIPVKLTKEETINLETTFSQSGYWTQTATWGNIVVNTSFLVQSETFQQLGFTRIRVPDEYREGMGHNIIYRVGCICKHIIKNNNINLTDWKNNLRFGVYNSTEEKALDEDLFIENTQWCNKISTKTWTEFTRDFIHNSRNPLYLVFSHDYLGNPAYEDIQFDFSQPILIEREFYGQVELFNKYPIPLSALLNNTDYAVVEMEKQTRTSPVICYDWNGADAFATEDVSIRSIIFNVDYNVSNNVELGVTIGADGYKDVKGYRNITLNKGSGTATLGGRFNLFGLTPHDLRGKADKLICEIEVSNPYGNKAIVELSNVRILVEYITIIEAPYGFTINGERGEEYGLWFYDMTYNLGTKNEIEEYSVTGTDKSIVNRMNITPKEIEIEFEIDECELKDAIALADDVILKLFTNRRNILTNKPTEKWIIFDHMPDKRYWFIRKDEIDDSVENGIYYAKVSLYISKGTAEVIPVVKSGSAGETNGLISIEPTIHLQVATDGTLSVNEIYTEQNVLIKNDKLKIGDNVTIDNENRRIWHKPKGSATEIDITSSVDFSTTWFRVRGEYHFESKNAIIIDVEYYERR